MQSYVQKNIMQHSTFLRSMRANLFRYGGKKVGYIMKIHGGGSSGTVAITWDAAAQMMNDRLSGGKLFGVTFLNLLKTVDEGILVVAQDNAKLYYTGHTIVENIKA